MIPVLRISISLLLLLAVLHFAHALGERLALGAEVQRKAVHAALGLYALSFPLIFAAPWEVAVLCAMAMALLAAVRAAPGLKERFGRALHGVQRTSLGEFYFALSIALLFALSAGRPALYVLPLLILALSDAAAAVVGSAYGRQHFAVESGQKSLEGSAVFFVTAWLLAQIALLLLSPLPRAEVITAAALLALFGTLIEAVSWRGLDNLLIPVGLFLLAERLLSGGTLSLALAGIVFLALLGATVHWGTQSGRIPHPLAAWLTTAFFIGIVGGWANLLAPLAVLIVHATLRRGRPAREEALSVVLGVIGNALFWFSVDRITGYDTDAVYNLGFALQVLMLLLWQSPRPGWVGAMGAVILAAGVAHLHLLAAPGLPSGPQFLAPVVVLLSSTLFLVPLGARLAPHRWQAQALLAPLLAASLIPCTWYYS